jgi:hypothetical protein
MAEQKVTVDLTTGIGTLSFPHLFQSNAGTNDKGETVYDLQFIIPKTDRAAVRDILLAIKKVGEAKWGANWKKARTPLRDGDKEKDDLTEDGSTKGEKYPERLGCYFMNARTTKPVGVYDRQRNPIQNPDEIYGGCKVKIAVTFYPYSQQGNNGVGVSLNGVQKISDGESFGGGRPSVESMFDLLDDEEDLGLSEEEYMEEEVEEAPPAKPAKKAAPAKKAPARKAKPEPEPEADDLEDLTADDEVDEDDPYADLDDLDDSDD